MRAAFLTLIAIALSVHLLWAQSGNADLLAQSPDGKTVKLVWFLKNVPAGFPGFDIKRKDGLDNWHTLNKVALLPGISIKKDLSPFESDNVETARIKEKLKDLLKAGKLHEYDSKTFIDKWKNNDKVIQEIMGLTTLDFDVSLICGFGFVDHTATQKIDYQYGLFLHGTDKLLDKVSWNYGEIADLNVVREITSRSVPGKSGVQLIWNADVNKIKTNYVAGFNIYKRGIRLNDRPIHIANPKDPSEYTWNDAGANSSVPDQYSISAESLFGIEGIIRPYTYNPEDHPSEYKKATVTEISSLGFYFKDGIRVEWTFPKEHERFIKGFYVEKDNMPDGYNRVSELLAPDVRSYIDKAGSSVNNPIRMKATALYNDRTLSSGIERLYSYFPMIDPPKPQNIRAVMAVENRKTVARITWDPMMNGDSATQSYKVYEIDFVNNRANMLAEKLPAKQPSFSLPVPPGPGTVYKFYVVAGGKFGGESTSDTVTVYSPSTELPAPVISKAVCDSDKAVIQWQYPEIHDLAGFRIYNNGTSIADEKVLGKNAREFTTAALQPGTTANFTVLAISDKGIISAASASVPIVVPAAPAKK